jgi:hypothetical protein
MPSAPSRVKIYQITDTRIRILDMDVHYRKLGIESISELDTTEEEEESNVD